MDPDSQPRKFTSPLLDPDAANELLARAAELDAHRRDAVSIAELRQAAVEAGISAEAFDAVAAGADLADSESVAHARPPHPVEAFLGAPVLVAGGLGLGMMSEWINRNAGRGDDAVLLVPLAGAAGLSVFLGFLYRRGVRLGAFTKANSVLWCAVLGGSVALGPLTLSALWDDGVALVAMGAVGSWVLGAMAVTVHFARARQSTDLSDRTRPGGSTTQAPLPLWRRILDLWPFEIGPGSHQSERVTV